MRLFLVRHADAVPVGGKILRDADRSLSDTGKREAALTAEALAVLEPSLTAVLVSPLLRARQTGERLAADRSVPVTLEVSPSLEPGFRPGELLEELFSRWKESSVALVGHQPDMGNLLSYLVSGDLSVDAAFKPGTIACVGVSGSPENFGGRLEWLMTPGIIQSLQQLHHEGGA